MEIKDIFNLLQKYAVWSDVYEDGEDKQERSLMELSGKLHQVMLKEKYDLLDTIYTAHEDSIEYPNGKIFFYIDSDGFHEEINKLVDQIDEVQSN